MGLARHVRHGQVGLRERDVLGVLKGLQESGGGPAEGGLGFVAGQGFDGLVDARGLSVRGRERSAPASTFCLLVSLVSSKRASSSSCCVWVVAFSSWELAKVLEVSPSVVCLFSRVGLGVLSSGLFVAFSSSGPSVFRRFDLRDEGVVLFFRVPWITVVAEA